MISFLRRRIAGGIFSLTVLLIPLGMHSQEPAVAPVQPETPPVPERAGPAPAPDAHAEAPPPDDAPSKPAPARVRSGAHRGRHSDVVFAFNRDARHAAGEETPEAVVAVGGSCLVEGNVRDAVVAVLGDARVDGEVGQSVVAVFGNTYINNRTDVAVAVFGGVELGPKAVVRQVVSVGGPVVRQPGSQVLGTLNELSIVSALPDYTGFRAWVRKGLFLARPLATGTHLGWAWSVAGIFLGIYVLFALVFPRGVERCIETLDTRPGRSFFAAVVSLVLVPVVAVVLSLTVVGFFLAVALIAFAIIFGKAAVLGWLGRRMMRGLGLSGLQAATALAVLLGGALAAAIYLVPVAGMMAWMLMLILAHGIGVYTLLLSLRRPRAAGPAVPAEAEHRQASTRAEAESALDASSRAGARAGFAASSGPIGENMQAQEAPPLPAVPSGEPLRAPAAVPPVPGASSYERAGFWLRMAALAIDLVLVGSMAVMMSMGAMFFLLAGAYGAVMWKLKGTTIGGIVCGLKVVRSDDRPMDWTVSIVRALGCFLSAFVAGLGFIWVAFDDEKQAWHDKIAGTVVVRVPAGVSLV
ncbi:MAG: RDD family protein [Opitutaceae bacterium]|nr:RDD family protein [Opitutaceae bacterium]